MNTAIALHQFTPTRLSIADALQAAEGAIATGEPTQLPYPRWVKIGYLKQRLSSQRLGASDHSIMYYREIAFEEIKEYQDICLARYPDYWIDLAQEAIAMSAAKKAGIPYPSRERVKPDKLPLTTRQAELIEEVAKLMRQWLDHRQVREALNAIHKQPE